MKLYQLAYICIFFLTLSCSEDDKAIEAVLEEVERGAILRNIDRVSPNFERTDVQSAFTVVLEEQDLEEGGIFDFVRLYLQYIDRSPENGDASVSEIILRDIPSSEFQVGGNGLPVGTIDVVFQEAIDALSLDAGTIQTGDQFELRAEIHLTDGRTFSTENGSASILTDRCFFKSPYRYVINVIDTIDDNLFTGVYNFEIVGEPLSPLLGFMNEGVATIVAGPTPNVRRTGIIEEGFEFTLAGDKVYPKIYQAFNDNQCRSSSTLALTGPDEQRFGQIDLSDDSVFELDFILGYEGWGAGIFITPIKVKYRFSKQ